MSEKGGIIRKQSVTKNFVLQFLYQGLILIIPLIISPYLTRVLGRENLGIYTYANSIAYYFLVFAMLGISRYGQRVISENRENLIQLRRSFWSLLWVHIFFSLLAIILYVFFVLIFVTESKTVYWLQIFYITSALFDITWFFQGLENFQSVVIRNAFVKIFECICILCFVKNGDDLGVYTFIVTFSLFIGQIVMLPQAITIAKPIKVNFKDLQQHLKPLCVLAIAVVAAALYTVFDKTLLGLLTQTDNVALYEYSNKIIQIPRSLITVIGAVLFPRACNMLAKGDYSGHRKYLKTSILVTFFIGFASIFGLVGISNQLAIEFYGEAFAECGRIIMYMSPLVLIIGLGDVLRTQFIIPMHMDEKYVLILCVNAVINIVISCALIPLIGVYGAVVGTGIAELFGLCIQVYICKKIIRICDLFKLAFPYILSGSIMLLVINHLPNVLDVGLLGLVIKIGVGGIIYIAVIIGYYFLFHNSEVKAFISSALKK